jgi:glycosyltransferase involved in cell wall biosynthesis
MPREETVEIAGQRQLLLYAPNVHTGGGLVLLHAMLKAWRPGMPLVAWLDARARDRLAIPEGSRVTWVEASFRSRFGAELELARAGKRGDRILCFHGLPPLFPNFAEIVVFLQNRLYLGQVDLASFSVKTRLRLQAEQFISRKFRHRVGTYWVQTPSMAAALKAWSGSAPVDVRVLPFAVPFAQSGAAEAKAFDFVYVADGEAHKNHRTLVDAWIRLKQRGLAPSLALTLSARDANLKQWVTGQARSHGLNIRDLGVVPHTEVARLYRRSRALVFPSLSESFGLPLIEANVFGLPILAGELDFVRDVCIPAETFNPKSSVSIERAVLRFLGHGETPRKPASAADFLDGVMEEKCAGMRGDV